MKVKQIRFKGGQGDANHNIYDERQDARSRDIHIEADRSAQSGNCVSSHLVASENERLRSTDSQAFQAQSHVSEARSFLR